MAVRGCPECGREVSDKAPQCIHCGYPLTAAPVRIPLSQRTPARAGWLAALLMVLLEVVSLLALRDAPPRVMLPYGVKPGMGIGRIMQQMEDHGFTYTHELQYSGYRVLFFGAGEVCGYPADFVSVRISDYGAIDVGAFFGEARDYGRRKPSALYDALRERLLQEYGDPQTDFNGVAAWENGSYMLMLSYTDNTGGELWLTCIYDPNM